MRASLFSNNLADVITADGAGALHGCTANDTRAEGGANNSLGGGLAADSKPSDDVCLIDNVSDLGAGFDMLISLRPV